MKRQLNINIDIDIPDNWDVDIKADELENKETWLNVLSMLTGNEDKLEQYIDIKVNVDAIISSNN